MATQEFMESINPATEEVLGRYLVFSREQIEQALVDAHHANPFWRGLSFERRAQMLQQAAAHLRSHKLYLASLITAEMGKPIVQSEAEVEKCAWTCDFFAANGASFLADEPHPSNSPQSYVAFDPLGTIMAIMPWNFPFWQVFRFAAPALIAGNTIVMKHSSNVPRCALAIEEVFRASGFPEGVFRTLLIPGSIVPAIIADPRIAAVTITGSDATGRSVAIAAASVIKKTVMELGGSDPFIVLEDADLDAAAQFATRSRFQNTGESCIAAKRFIIVDSAAEAFLQRFIANTSALKVGDPAERATEIGPLARRDLLEALEEQVQVSVAQGARIILGGRHLDGPGYFYAPTILTNVTSAMPVFRQETFGPVAAVVQVHDTEEAIAMANDTSYGLGSNLWTGDMVLAKQLARRIEAGNVFINGMVASDPRLPFGGIKQSGYGRELSEFGIREFTNVKTIWISSPVEQRPRRAPSE